eukprot:10429517-Alexandrium_andersonii.AAC.1
MAGFALTSRTVFRWPTSLRLCVSLLSTASVANLNKAGNVDAPVILSCAKRRGPRAPDGPASPALKEHG